MLRNMEQRMEYINDSSNWIIEDTMCINEKQIEMFRLFRLKGTNFYKLKAKGKNYIKEEFIFRNFPFSNSILFIENGCLKETLTEVQAAKHIMGMKEWIE